MDRYVKIRTEFITDEKLSPIQFRILVYLASKVGNWNVVESQIQHELNLGRDATGRALRDLRQLGWISEMRRARDKDTGKWINGESHLLRRDEIVMEGTVSAGGIHTTGNQSLETTGVVSRTAYIGICNVGSSTKDDHSNSPTSVPGAPFCDRCGKNHPYPGYC